MFKTDMSCRRLAIFFISMMLVHQSYCQEPPPSPAACSLVQNFNGEGLHLIGNDETPQRQGPPGKRGPQGLPGPVGNTGQKGEAGSQGPAGEKGTSCDTSLVSQLQTKVEQLERVINDRLMSCNEIKLSNASSQSGVYTIYSKYGNPYEVFCEMDGNGGGWTLVASIHENDMTGRCTVGDRWSSETGLRDRKGDSNWENRNIFGDVDFATTDDYKNRGYFELEARQLMVMQVPNNTPVDHYVSSATFQYYTESSVLQENGGNLRNLFRSYPLLDNQLTKYTDNGPSSPIIFLKGNPTSAHRQYGSATQGETQPGFVQFRAVSWERGAFPLCLYGKIRPNKGNVEHACLGGTRGSTSYCGDLSAFDLSSSWGTNAAMRESVYFLLYR